jgi:predicted PurR-regulated permease PerM
MSSKSATVWFLGILLALFAGVALLIAWPFLRSIAAAIIVAVIFYPLYRKVLKWIGNRPSLASLITTLGLVFLFLIPVTLVLLKATSEAATMAQRLARMSAEQGGFAQFATALLARPLAFLGRFVDISQIDIRTIVTSNLQKASVLALSSGAAILGNIARLIAHFFLMLIVVFFLFRDGPAWADAAGSMMPLSPAQTDRLFRNITDTIIGNVYGIVSVGVVQGLLTGIAVAITGLPSPLLLGLAAFFASIIPVVGAALVWVPAGLYLIFTGALWKGIFVLAWGSVVISTADNIVRPWVVSGKVELHPLVLLFFILGGVEVFGFLGLFLGPVIASVLSAVFKLLREELATPALEVSSSARSADAL